MKQNSSEIQEGYKYISKVELFENELLSYSNGTDSILVVVNKDIFKNCNNPSLIQLKDSTIKRITQLKDKDKIFHFYFKMKSVNNDLDISVYNFTPIDTLQKELIFSYRSFPYHIENCKQLK
jgi:hypothetical protein